MEELNRKLAKVPFLFLAILYIGWLSYEYYDWLHAPQSPLTQKKTIYRQKTANLKQVKKKLKAAEEFYKNLDVLRARIQQLSEQLQNTKNTLNAEIDIAKFVRMISLEAKKLGLVIKGINPQPEIKREYYIEVPFEVQTSGAYIQSLVFFDRVAKLNQVIRISEFRMSPSGGTRTKYVELQGTAKLLAFKYLGTKADEIVTAEESKK